MTAYAIAHLHNPQINDDIVEYLERIQVTLDPFEGRFLVHGAQVEVLEAPWPGTIVVIGFPDLDAARAWYDSAPYQAILHLRTDHIDAAAILVDGVAPGYDPSARVAAMRQQPAG